MPSDDLRTRDVRALLRVLGEVHELERAGEGAMPHFLRGVAAITGADVAILAQARNIDLRRPPRMDCVVDFGWPCASDRRHVYDYVTAVPLGRDPLTAALLRSGRRLVTGTRAEATSGRSRHCAELARDVHRPVSIDDSLLSIKQDHTGRALLVVLKRGLGRSPFGARERSLIHLLQQECAWALELPHPPQPDRLLLRPRERDVLARLATGESQKQIASAMGISPHTAHDYVKAIYKKLGVSSRAELMASRFVRGSDRRQRSPV